MEVTMTNTNNTRAARITADQAMIAGVKQFLSTFATLPVGATNMTPANIVKLLQERISTAQAAQTADAAFTAAVKADKDEQASTKIFIGALRRIVVGMFQEAPDTLAIFGVKAPKVRTTTVAVKAAAAAKNKATRAARGTVGKKKKLAIKGTTPASNGAAAAPATPAPATPAPAAVVAATPAPVPPVHAAPIPATPTAAPAGTPNA
jgi:DNA polymerase-3 subunit gamma/tau